MIKKFIQSYLEFVSINKIFKKKSEIKLSKKECDVILLYVLGNLR